MARISVSIPKSWDIVTLIVTEEKEGDITADSLCDALEGLAKQMREGLKQRTEEEVKEVAE